MPVGGYEFVLIATCMAEFSKCIRLYQTIMKGLVIHGNGNEWETVTQLGEGTVRRKHMHCPQIQLH